MRIESTINPASAASIKRKLGPIMRSKTEQVGAAMVEAATAQMASNFDTGRAYERRRSPGSRRAVTSLDYIITEDEDGVRVDYRVLGGDEVVMRIIILNFGSVDHDIGPSGNWEIGGLNPKSVSRTASVANESGEAGDRLAYPSKYGGYWRGAEGQSVHHPGTNGTGFLEAGRNAALNVL